MSMTDTKASPRREPLVPAWIRPLVIPTPFSVRPVNAYLIEDEPVVLLDTGPNYSIALSSLEAALAEQGRRVEEIGLVLLTHQHYDHLGLAATVQARSGAEVAGLEPLVAFARDCTASIAAEREYQARVMEIHGVPEETVRVLRQISVAFTRFGASVNITRTLRDGDAIELGRRRLRVEHRPGHSPTDTLFVEEDEQVAFVGDHLIAHISSNPTIQRPLGRPPDPYRRPPALVSYLESMERTFALELELLLPGHGPPIVDHRRLITERRGLHRQRMDRIHRELGPEPRTAHSIACTMWDGVPLTQALLTLSEVLGHLDLLIAEGRACEVQLPTGLGYVAG
jgi:glyoxylase-like metal-dependent hydrolase (beta-lactamase superfamily II)